LDFHSTPIAAAGSSLIGYGLDWDVVAKDFSRPVKMIGAPAGSPCELEFLQDGVPETDFTLLGISVSDMSEYSLSDFRAVIVPVLQTWRDLRQSQADRDLATRILGQYPLQYLRLLFPTAGRSTGVMVGIRKIALQWLARRAAGTSDPLPTFESHGSYPTNRISDWDHGRVLRNVELDRVACGGRFWFAGPKHLALERMLRRAAARGKVVVVVMPDSPLYMQEVIDAWVPRAFEESMVETARRVPEAKWIRLDRIPELQSNTLYWDLVHLNADARPLATAALLKQLEPILRAP
jgi:hypothetical protein